MRTNLLLTLACAAALLVSPAISAQNHRALVVDPQDDTSEKMDTLFTLVEEGWTVVDAFSLRTKSDASASSPRVLRRDEIASAPGNNSRSRDSRSRGWRGPPLPRLPRLARLARLPRLPFERSSPNDPDLAPHSRRRELSRR